MSRTSFTTQFLGTFDGHGWKCDSCTKELRRTEEELRDAGNRTPLAFPDDWFQVVKGIHGNSDQAFPEAKHICAACAQKLFNGDLRSIPAQSQLDKPLNPSPQNAANNQQNEDPDAAATRDQIGKAGRQ